MSRKIVLTGGGSGGHITPILAVAEELKRRNPDNKIIYVGQRGDRLGDIPAKNPNIDETYTVRAGKFRRYHGEGFRQLLDLPTLFKNIRDFFLVIIGLVQSWRLMGQLRPDIVFSRGGFVSVPVALGAAMRGVPYITHDSDPLPSLANRIIARWAVRHAVALPADLYPYPQAKTVTTGIPLNREFQPVTGNLKTKYRKDLGLSVSDRVLFIIGGGLGSQRVNRAVGAALPHLLTDFKDLKVFHVVGRANEAEMTTFYQGELASEVRGRVEVMGFIDDVYRYSAAADLVITRAGATNLAEFSLQGKACVIIPSPFLTGGHQIKNSEYLAEKGAAAVVSESELSDDPNRLTKLLAHLLRNPEEMTALGKKLAGFGRPDAAKTIADLILKHANGTAG